MTTCSHIIFDIVLEMIYEALANILHRFKTKLKLVKNGSHQLVSISSLEYYTLPV